MAPCKPASEDSAPPKPRSPEVETNVTIETQPVRPGTPTGVQAILKALELVLLAAAYSPVSQLCLSPVYGSIPASIYHPQLMMTAVTAGWLLKASLFKYIPTSIASHIPLHTFWIPAMQEYLFRYSSTWGPHYGPLFTELLTYFPLVVMSIFFAALEVDIFKLSPLQPAIVSYIVFTAAEKLSTEIIRQNIGSSLIFTRAGLQFAVATFYALLLPSRFALMLAALPIYLTLSYNVHVPLERPTQVLNATLHTHGYSLVARQESTTGYISVLDNINKGYRVMRNDHCLLGGEWTPQSEYPWIVKDPIYSVFTILEAVRLVEAASVPDSQANALVIGLGIGTTPAALLAHGIKTTTVEIDPVVVDFATTYFALPNNYTSIIEDAVTFVSRQNTLPSPTTYNYIIHDVFTGGAEPINLFTEPFLRGLHNLLKRNGVIAINYAGDISLPSTSDLLTTITSIFPTCRAFRETPPEPSNDVQSDFTNLVIFCLKASTPLSFRIPREADFLRSNSRRENLLPKFEVSIEEMRRRNGSRPRSEREKRMAQEKERRESALGHWRIMRTVLPDVVWENW